MIWLYVAGVVVVSIGFVVAARRRTAHYRRHQRVMENLRRGDEF